MIKRAFDEIMAAHDDDAAGNAVALEFAASVQQSAQAGAPRFRKPMRNAEDALASREARGRRAHDSHCRKKQKDYSEANAADAIWRGAGGNGRYRNTPGTKIALRTEIWKCVDGHPLDFSHATAGLDDELAGLRGNA